MVDKVTLNARKPEEDEYGLAMLNRMNERHQSLYDWAFEKISVKEVKSVLDIGFGGGKNIRNISNLAPESRICGIDYSKASYNKCAEFNSDLIADGRLELKIGSADELPYANKSFDLATAFETIYYWPNIEKCFQNVLNVLNENGVFLVCNEDSSNEGNEEIADALSMNFYSEADLQKLLSNAGFSKVNTYSHENGKWVCAVASK